MSAEVQRRTRVLIVDADASFREEALRALGAAGVQARGAADLQAARRALSQFEPDVLFLELDLPDNGGIAILRILRDEYIGTRPRVIVATHGDLITAARARADAMDDERLLDDLACAHAGIER